MEKSLIFKPVFWRLFIYRLIPAYAGGALASIGIDMVSNEHFIFTPFLQLMLALAVSFGILVGMLFTRESLDIVIREGNISGPGSGFFLPRETFPVSALDFSYRDKQSLYEKISFFRTIHSISGQKIIVVDSIYGKLVTKELYQLLEEDYS